ncbi:hypothetical protein VARIO8X_20123 [Burkholderiales bacterium 8X]|nr:hypothetical protein VARIO8X_20123 [Burkholderiales bacterium 8X]
MQVARQHEVGRMALRVVAGRERPDEERLVHHVDVEFGRRIAGTAVVIAAHQRAGDLRVSLAPGRDGRNESGRMGLWRMEEVAEEHDVLRRQARAEAIDAGQVFLGGAARHRLAQGAEGGRLSEMKVGDEENVMCRPPEGALEQQFDLLACKFDLARR